MREAWWTDVAVGAPVGVGVHVGPDEVRVECPAVRRGNRVAAAIGVGIAILAVTGLVEPRAVVAAAVGSLAGGALTWRWLSRPTVVRLDGSRLVVEDPSRGVVAVLWTDVVGVVLQEALPDLEGTDRGIPASVRVERRRPPIGPAEPLRLGAHLDDDGRAWLLAVVTTFWRASGPPPGGGSARGQSGEKASHSP